MQPMRAGRRYNLDTLIARHGAAFGIPELLRLLSDDCPKRKRCSSYPTWPDVDESV
jgi:hypothetical protein